MLSGSFNTELCQMTQQAIDLLHEHKGNNDLEVVLVESTLSTYKYTNCTIVHNIRPKFNYNQSLVLGIRVAGKSDAYILCNNDIVPQEGYLDALIESGYNSCSPACPELEYHKGVPEIWEGYRTTYQVCGWFIFMRSYVLSQLSLLELFPMELGFWYQDNWYADQLQKANIKHALISQSQVIHLESQTHDYLPEGMTKEQYKVYLKLKG